MLSNIDLRNFLEQRDYLIECRMANNGCVLTLPERIEDPLYIPLIIAISFIENGVQLSYAPLIDINAPPIESKLEIPNYAIKAFVVAKISSYCKLFRYNPLLIKFRIGNLEVEIDEFIVKLPLTLSDEEIQQHIVLMELAVKFIQHNDLSILLKEAEKLNVLEGFNIFIETYTGDL